MTSPDRCAACDALQKRLGIQFQNEALLAQALTHRSYLAEVSGLVSNERLEFLGDAVLGLIVAEALYRLHDDWSEGDLTKAKASIVDTRALEMVARAWDVGVYMLISRGEELSGGRDRRALLADAVEAVIGAYYLDQGLDACRAFVLREMAVVTEAIARQEYARDYKTLLQEVLQARFQAAPSYEVVNETGLPHVRMFEVVVRFRGEDMGHGEGRSKKQAEQQAAARALEKLAEETPPTA